MVAGFCLSICALFDLHVYLRAMQRRRGRGCYLVSWGFDVAGKLWVPAQGGLWQGLPVHMVYIRRVRALTHCLICTFVYVQCTDFHCVFCLPGLVLQCFQ